MKIIRIYALSRTILETFYMTLSMQTEQKKRFMGMNGHT